MLNMILGKMQCCLDVFLHHIMIIATKHLLPTPGIIEGKIVIIVKFLKSLH